MKNEDFDKAKILRNRIEFYSQSEKLLKATGVQNILIKKELENDSEELVELKELLLPIFTARLNDLIEQFDKL